MRKATPAGARVATREKRADGGGGDVNSGTRGAMRVMMVWAWVSAVLVSACAPVHGPPWVATAEPPGRTEGDRTEPLVVLTGARRARVVDPTANALERLAAVVPDLRELEIRGGVGRLEALGHFQNLERLAVSGVLEVDMRPLAAATSLRELTLELPRRGDAARIGSLAMLASLRELVRLRIVAPQDDLVVLLQTLPRLPRLSDLAIDANGGDAEEDAPDLARLAELPSLRTLEIGARRKLVRLDGIEESEVTTLLLREAFASLAPLTRRHRRLRTLTLESYGGAPPTNVPFAQWSATSHVADLRELGKLQELKALELIGLVASDLSFLRSLPKLDRLGLREATIADISALLFVNLCQLDVRDVRRLSGDHVSLDGNRGFLDQVDQVVSTLSCPERCEARCRVRWRGRVQAPRRGGGG